MFSIWLQLHMHVSTRAFPQLPFPSALSLEAEEWMIGKEEGCYALGLDTKFQCRGRPPASQFPLLCSQSLYNILSWRAVSQPNVSMTNTVCFLGGSWIRVTKTFDWRPPKFYFRIWKSIVEGHVLLIKTSSMVNQKKKKLKHRQVNFCDLHFKIEKNIYLIPHLILKISVSAPNAPSPPIR